MRERRSGPERDRLGVGHTLLTMGQVVDPHTMLIAPQ